MAWQLTRSLDALRDEVKQGLPNVTIYTIGDDAHRQRTSDHNPDDTSGSKAEQSDSDSTQEVRAIDIMLNVSAQSARIVQALIDPRSRARLKYVIHGGKIWSRTNGWAVKPFTSDPHNDHIHVSGLAADDANGAGWPAVAEIWKDADDMFDDKDRDALTSVNYRLYAQQQDLDFADFTITSGRKFHDENKAKQARVALEQRVAAIEAALQTPPGTVEITDEQLERVMRKVIGSVDGSPS